METKPYDYKLFNAQKLLDYRNLRLKPLHIHLKKGKNDEDYYLGMYISEIPNEYSKQVNSLTSYCNELRKHEWFFNIGKKLDRRLMDYIQAMLDL
ncbi:hypothetical protein [Aquimarina algiphila]|uniref:hypothetical protein n=1 Tax=Aquimarina algiphila TaxID=2047982 RepID=UPI00232EF363|nr:hypothetical protein [Aquimarina algiphila]